MHNSLNIIDKNKWLNPKHMIELGLLSDLIDMPLYIYEEINRPCYFKLNQIYDCFQ